MGNAVSTEVRSAAPAAAKPIDRFKAELELRKAMLAPMLPQRVPFDRFVSGVCTAVAFNPKLMDADRASLFRAAATAAELGLSLNPAMGECDILPVWNNKLGKNEAQCRPRVKGMMKLARNSGEIAKIYAHVAYENDKFEWELGLNKRLVHVPRRDQRGEMAYAYCVWKTTDGEEDFEVMSRQEIYKIRGRSSSKNKNGEVTGPWITDEEEMWRKTVVKRATKYMPLSAEALVKAAKVDNIHEGGGGYEIDAGEIVDVDAGAFGDAIDITGDDGGETASSAQVEGLEAKVQAGRRSREPEPQQQPADNGFGDEPQQREAAPKRQPKAKEPEQKAEPQRPATPVVNPEKDSKNRVNWAGYADDVREALAELDPDVVTAWKADNQSTLDEMEFEQPGLAEQLEDWIAQKMGA